MKKVCIVTCYKTANYGSRLQALALSMAVEKAGCEPYFLGSFKDLPFMIRHPRLLYARIYKKLNEKKRKSFFIPVPYRMTPEREVRMNRFTKDHCRELHINDDRQWKQAIAEKMIFVAGSDIIWNPAFGYPASFFLDFACYAKLPCFSFGTSVGAASLPEKFYPAYRRYLGHYQCIGVREESTIGLFSKIIDKPLTKVTDPTLLLTAAEWDTLADRAEYSEQIDKEYIFAYFVMNDARYWEYVKKAQEATGLQVVVIPMHFLDEEQPFSVIKDGTPYEFISLIRNAKMIITDSFHVCSFSLIYEKDFYLLRRERKAEDAKYDDFLTRYRLADRVVTEEDRFVPKEKTDYTYAAQKLAEDRTFSRNFLQQALKACEQQ